MSIEWTVQNLHIFQNDQIRGGKKRMNVNLYGLETKEGRSRAHFFLISKKSKSTISRTVHFKAYLSD